ncbi:SRPBCC family protein [Dongia deserti]|uniref:SRPBCC family protein n=1 Tax=Dongia deserti TaxID=2268030 RepID=UPI000E64FFF3|nr:SRPBCC family protein [Dongia deserti]
MERIEKHIEVDVPVSTAYNQFTQFEEFPKFMEGVEQITQIDDKHTHWRVEIAGHTREFDSEITEQVPDKVIAWRSTTPPFNAGRAIFEPLESNKCRVTLQMEYEPEGMVENVGSSLGLVGNRAKGDLERFKAFIESRGSETGAWRGELH